MTQVHHQKQNITTEFQSIYAPVINEANPAIRAACMTQYFNINKHQKLEKISNNRHSLLSREENKAF